MHFSLSQKAQSIHLLRQALSDHSLLALAASLVPSLSDHSLFLGDQPGCQDEPLHALSCWPNPSSSLIRRPASSPAAERPRDHNSKMAREASSRPRRPDVHRC